MMEKFPDAREVLRLCAKASAIAVSRMGAADSIPTVEEVKTAEVPSFSELVIKGYILYNQ